MDTNNIINSSKTSLGIELGSTRIKAILIGENAEVLAQGNFEWENSFLDGFWTYSLEDINKGLKTAYKNLKESVYDKYKLKLTRVGSLGISAMMHGFLAFDKDMNLLTPFRTWRNTNTDDASSYLTNLFNFNIPHRWSISHLYQAILNEEDYIDKIDYITTLSGYVHYLLTGKKVLGIGDASGMFPIDSDKTYNKKFIDKFNNIKKVKDINIKLENLLPDLLLAGDDAGKLTVDGAKLLDESGDLEAEIAMCPPEGDAGTGMVATNSINERTGNISVGTSIFSMIVLENELKKYYREIDMVTTPDGKPVAMVHCNNGTSDFDSWLSLFKEFARDMGLDLANQEKFYELIYKKAMGADSDAGGLITYNYLSGEPISGVLEGRPLFMRKEDSKMNLSNFILANLYSIMATIRIGQDILTNEENVRIDEMLAHGGVFKTKDVMQNITAAALDTKVGVYQSASEGGAWGIALLASFTKNKKENQTLGQYLDEIFEKENTKIVKDPDESLKEGFDKFLERYKKALAIEKEAGKNY